MRHYYGPSTVNTPKKALTQADLQAIASLLDLGDYEDARDWCAFTFAFFGLLRINEYAGGGLRQRHVQSSDSSVEITILHSKTSQHPVTVSLASRPGDVLCPASAHRWLHWAGEAHRLPQGPDAPLFLTRLDSSPQRVEPTTAEEFIRRLRFFLGAVRPDVDTARYAGHSFRRGGATAMLLAGVEPAVIQRHGRWQSDTWRQYIDTLDNPAVRLLATRSLHRRSATSAPAPPRRQ